MKTWAKYYFIIFYLILLFVNIYTGIATFSEPDKDYWEKAECPIKSNYKYITNVECEKHISFQFVDKIIITVIFFFLSLVFPFLVLIMAKLMTGGDWNID